MNSALGQTITRRQFLASSSAALLLGQSPFAEPLFRVKPAWFRPGLGQMTMSFETAQPAEIELLCGRTADQMVSVHSDRYLGAGSIQVCDSSLEGIRSVIVRARCPGSGWAPSSAQQLAFGRRPGSTFRLAVLADGHLPAVCRDPVRSKNLRKTMEMVIADQPDFVVFLGDEVGLLRNVNKNREITERSVQAAWDAWRSWYSPLLQRIPSFFVLGNHEAEVSYLPGPKDLPVWAADSRRSQFLNPSSDTYAQGGESSGLQNYYAWEWGDALFVVLDVSRYARRLPRSPEDWTLGREQMDWLERVLLNSSARWKFVFSHHLVGGWPFDPSGRSRRNYHAYARGGGVYGDVGEQARVNALMIRAGAQFFLYGHDHVVHHDQCRDVNYMCCGRSSYVTPGHTWFDNPGWSDAYGGRRAHRAGKFLAGVGFMRITVAPNESKFEYVCTAQDSSPGENLGCEAGQIAWQRVFKVPG